MRDFGGIRGRIMTEPRSEHGRETRSQAGTGPGIELGIALRGLAASDLDAVLAMARETLQAPHWSRQDYEQILLSDSSAAFSRLGLVAHSGGTLAGFAVASLSWLEKIAELETIVVHPRFRRRGIGTRLLIASKALAQGAGATLLRLEVRESNRDAIALYLALGFQPTGRRKSYYSAPVEDALLLEVRLETPSG
jgi:[ribosomal protein S18]-alanine N-acetyltransferase